MNSVEKFRIKLSGWAYKYCIDVEDDPMVRQYITESFFAYLYCKDIKDRPEIRQYISSSICSYIYCRDMLNTEQN